VPDDGPLAAQDIDRLALVRLGTLERDFAVVVGGAGPRHDPIIAFGLATFTAANQPRSFLYLIAKANQAPPLMP
jgi:hypothetical protein